MESVVPLIAVYAASLFVGSRQIAAPGLFVAFVCGAIAGVLGLLAGEDNSAAGIPDAEVANGQRTLAAATALTGLAFYGLGRALRDRGPGLLILAFGIAVIPALIVFFIANAVVEKDLYCQPGEYCD